MRLIDADEALRRLPDDLPYKSSVRSFGSDHWNCAIDAFEIRDVLSNIEAKKKNHGYL